MPATNCAAERPVAEQIDVLKSKITLLDGDAKAYYETAQFALKKNREKIQHLRKENKELHKKLSESLSKDEHVINEAFRNNPVERAALRNKTGHDAVVVMDHKVCDILKQLNALRHIRVERQKKLELLQTTHSGMVKDAEDIDATEKGDSKEAQTMRYLENNQDKAQLKMHEANHIYSIYQEIKAKLQDDALNFDNNIRSVENEIMKSENELKELQAMQNDALLAKESAQTDLHRQEEIVHTDRKKREYELQKLKKEAEEKKLVADRIEKRIAQRVQSRDENYPQADKTPSEEHFKKITSYEDAFRRIKEATGVSDTSEVVVRFISQGDTTAHLEKLKRDNERQLVQLKEDKCKLQKEFENMKYSGESKISSGQQVLEEFQDHLDKEEKRKEIADGKLARASEIIIAVKAGVEHLAIKLKHLKSPKTHILPQKPDSDEYVLDQLGLCEEKLVQLVEEMESSDVTFLANKMIGDEFKLKVESKLPEYNTRIDLPHMLKDMAYDDDDDSGEDDADVPSRLTIKKQAQFLIDSKTKRRTQRRKKRTK